MKLSESKRSKRKAKQRSEEEPSEKVPGSFPTVATTAIWNGERVSIENRELLEEIRLADDPVEKVSSLSLMDFVKAGMDTLKNPFSEGPMAKFIAKYRDQLAFLQKSDPKGPE